MVRGSPAGLRYIGTRANGNRDLGLSNTPLKFIFVGDPNVGKTEFYSGLPKVARSSIVMLPPEAEPPHLCTIMLDGRDLNVQLWDTSEEHSLDTVLRLHARGAHGICIVYDITRKSTFKNVKKWLKDIERLLPDIPRVLIGNRLHLEFDRQVSRKVAEKFASKRSIEYYEVSTLAHFNVDECLTQLARQCVKRMHRTPRVGPTVESLENVCCAVIARNMRSIHCVEQLPVPSILMPQLRSFATGGQVASAALPIKHTRRNRSKISDVFSSAFKLVRRIAHASFRKLRTTCTVM